MTNPRTDLKSLVVYAITIPLALLIGYLLANQSLQDITLIGVVLLLLCAPLAIHFHYPLMLVAWNMGAVVFFLPGRMYLWMVAILLSFGMSFSHRILDKRIRFLWVPEITRPLIFLAVVALVTAQLRGGFGFRFMGGEAAGSRRYVELVVGILGFFALSALHISPEQRRRYLGLFYLGGLGGAIAVLFGHLPDFMNFIFLFIPPQTVAPEGGGVFIAFRPLTWPAIAVMSYVLARHGLRGVIAPLNGRRFLVVVASILVVIFSGSRLGFVVVVMILSLLYWFEGLVRSRLTPFVLLACILAAALIAPFAHRLPLSMQRTLAILPIEVDPMARATAEGSSEWRREIWRVTIPEIPKYLLLGKGYAISREDLSYMMDASFGEGRRVEDRSATIAGDFHNGPLSVIIPFGIWGVLGFVWFLIAGYRVLRRNYLFGGLDLAKVNTFLLVSYLVATISFVFVMGSLQTGMVAFTGIIGLSVALNGGVARPPAPQPVLPPRKPGPPGPRPSHRLPARSTPPNP